MPKPTEILPDDHAVDRTLIKYPIQPDLIYAADFHCFVHGANDTHDTKGCFKYASLAGFLPNPKWQKQPATPTNDPDESQPGPSKPTTTQAMNYAGEKASNILAKVGQAKRVGKKLMKDDVARLEKELAKVKGGRVGKQKK